LIRTHNETLSGVAMRVCNKDRSPMRVGTVDGVHQYGKGTERLNDPRAN
jgi:hypothetical protein